MKTIDNPNVLSLRDGMTKPGRTLTPIEEFRASFSGEAEVTKRSK